MIFKKDIDIEKLLIWTYQDQAAMQVVSRSVGYAFGGGGDSFGAVERYGRLGCFPDCAGAAAVGNDELHPDAERVYETVAHLPVQTAGLVVLHARAGTRPDWIPEGTLVKPEYRLTAGGAIRRRKDGSPRVHMIYDDNRNGIACRIVVNNPPQMLRFHRAQYALWHEALAVLVKNLSGLREYSACGPGAAGRPWGGGKEALTSLRKNLTKDPAGIASA